MRSPAGELRLRSGRIVTPAGTIAGEVVIRGGRIAAVGEPAGGAAAVELGDRWLVPGFIDTHVHGGDGAQFNSSDPDEIAAVARFHAAHGTTAMLATLLPAPPEELESALAAISASELTDGATVLGVHLEGPFLSAARPGALDRSSFREPDQVTLRSLLAAGRGRVRMITLAPELPGALALISALVEAGVVVSLGHTDAGYECARDAVRAGARSATHLFNAMRGFDHHAPGVLGAVLDHPEVSCELICDGVHVDPSALRLAYRAKGSAGVRLVTDAIAAAGMPDGEYRVGSAPVMVAGGRVTLAAGGTLAGSTLTMDAAVAGAVRWLGIGVADAVALASVNPARLLGIDSRKGSISPGRDADLAVLDDELRACATLVAGRWVHCPAAQTH